jgi:uncharacterized protein (TIGR03086 family)
LVPPPAESERDVDRARSAWAARLEAQTDRVVASWSDPGAWDGMTRMGSPMEMPAATSGGMVLGELVVHGWDLARATGKHPRWSDEVLEFTYDMAAKTAEQGREMGATGRRSRCRTTHPCWTGSSD